MVGGAVAAARRRIGLLKAVGFTPAQVVRAYVAQALVPATIGAALGLLAGNAAAAVVLGAAGRAYGTGTPSVPPWIDVAVPTAVLTAVATSALVPALRAGRLRSVEATAAGPAPGADRCRTVGRRLGALPLPRPLSLGLAAPFLRPARTATMTAAVALGAIGITFGLGLTLSLDRIQQGMADRPVGDVVVNAVGGPRLPRGAGEHHGRDGSTARFLPTPPAAASSPALAVDAAAHTGGATQDSIAAAIAGQPGTRRWFGTGQTHLGVAGLAGSTTVITFTGDSTWSPYQLVAGSWFHGPGEAVVPSGLLTTTGTHIGSTLTLTNNRRRTSVRIVGEVFDLQGGGLVVLTDLRSLTGLDAYELPASLRYDIDVTPGTDPTRYVRDLDTALAGTGAGGRLNHGGASNSVVLAMDALSWMLTLLLLATAGLGVLSTVVLDTRDRARELGVFKALGMTPRQTVAMVLTSVAGVGLVAGCLGVPIGTALHDLVLPAMGDSVGTRIPAADVAVYSPALFAVLVVAGVAVAVAGALLPASWAAHARTAVALRTE